MFGLKCRIYDDGAEEWLSPEEWKSIDDEEYAYSLPWFCKGYGINNSGSICVYVMLGREYGPDTLYADGEEVYKSKD